MPVERLPIEPLDTPVRVERIGAVSWRILAAIAVALLAVAIAVVKPWELAPEQSRARAPGFGSPSLSPAPTDDPEIQAALQRELCSAPPEWRLLTMELTALGDSRTMYGASPAEANGPADPSIPTARLSAIRLYGIGLCRPNASGRPSVDKPLEGVTLWEIPQGGAPLRVDRVSVLDAGLFRLGEAYFGPVSDEADSVLAAHVPLGWQPGRYVFEIDATSDAGHSLWVALDFATPVARRPGG